MKERKIKVTEIDLRLIAFFQRTFIPVARFSIFLIFFWFGLIRLVAIAARPLTTKNVWNGIF